MADNKNRPRRRRRVRNSSGPSGSADEELRHTLMRVNPKFINAGFRLPFQLDAPTGMVGIPDSFRILLKYSQIVSVGGSASPSPQVFQINSLFDPDLTGTGHQPSYFDFWKQNYTRYIVLGFSAILDIENETASVGMTVASVYSDTDISSSTTETLSEASRGKVVVVGPTGAMNTKRLVMPAVTVAQIMGQKFLQPDSNMYSVVTASPADVCFMITRCSAMDSSTTLTARIKYTMLFDVVFKDSLTQYAS